MNDRDRRITTPLQRTVERYWCMGSHTKQCDDSMDSDRPIAHKDRSPPVRTQTNDIRTNIYNLPDSTFTQQDAQHESVYLAKILLL
jgi:hypothetical protein